MASLVDGSKPTPADASRAGNPALPIGQTIAGNTGNTGNSPWTAPRE